MNAGLRSSSDRLLKIVYVLTCRMLGLVVILFRSDRAIAAEVLVLLANPLPAPCAVTSWTTCWFSASGIGARS